MARHQMNLMASVLLGRGNTTHGDDMGSSMAFKNQDPSVHGGLDTAIREAALSQLAAEHFEMDCSDSELVPTATATMGLLGSQSNSGRDASHQN